VYNLADVGLLTPEMEKLGLLGPTDKSSRRPGDVSIKNWAFNRGLIWAFTLAASNLGYEPCELYAKNWKHKL